MSTCFDSNEIDISHDAIFEVLGNRYFYKKKNMLLYVAYCEYIFLHVSLHLVFMLEKDLLICKT